VELDFKNLQQRLVLAEREIVHLKEEVCMSALHFTWLHEGHVPLAVADADFNSRWSCCSCSVV